MRLLWFLFSVFFCFVLFLFGLGLVYLGVDLGLFSDLFLGQFCLFHPTNGDVPTLPSRDTQAGLSQTGATLTGNSMSV